MSNMNGTGPIGAGQGTGRGLGPCGGGSRRGNCGWFGWRRWSGRFFRTGQNNLKSLDEEEKMLQAELEAVKAEKEALKKENK